MHTFKYERITFIHHGDYSENVEIHPEGGHSVVVPFDGIKAFVAEYVRSNKIRFLEDATDDEILEIK